MPTEIDEFASKFTFEMELERTSLMEKSGIFTGAYAIIRSRASACRFG